MNINNIEDRFTNVNPYPKDNFNILKTEMNGKLVDHRSEIINKVNNHDILIIVAGTGSGKTTQIPQFFYKNPKYAKQAYYDKTLKKKIGKRIIISIPKKISTIGTAEFVARQIAQNELQNTKFAGKYYKDEKEAQQIGLENYVGYSVRNDTWRNNKTVIEYMTDGMVINEFQKDPYLSDISLILLDEVHERSINNDILMGLIPDVIESRRVNNMDPLKCIIMSATLDEKAFMDHFKNLKNIKVCEEIYNVPGVQNEIITKFINNPIPTNESTISTIIKYVIDFHSMKNVKEKIELSILVFLSTKKEIILFCEQLNEYINQKKIYDMDVFPLYANLPRDDQIAATNGVNKGKRKVIVSTNYAEASVTIPNLFLVIDTGFKLESSYDPILNLNTLLKTNIDKAAANQRKGRAGRENVINPKYHLKPPEKFFTFQKEITKKIPGLCWRLYTNDKFNELKNTSDPTILREEISSKYLFLKTLNKDPKNFNWMTPPDKDQLSRAEHILTALGALNENKEITNQGKVMARFNSLEPMHSVILLSSKNYNCQRKALSLVAILSTIDNFENLYIYDYTDLSQQEIKEYRSKVNDKLDALVDRDSDKNSTKIMSDHLKVLAIFEAYLRKLYTKDVLIDNFKKKEELQEQIREEIRKEIQEIRKEYEDEEYYEELEKQGIFEEEGEFFKEIFQEKLKIKSEELASENITEWCKERYLNEQTLNSISAQRNKLLKLYVNLHIEVHRNKFGEEKNKKELENLKKNITKAIEYDGDNNGVDSIRKCMLQGYFLNIAQWNDEENKYEVINMSELPKESLAMPYFTSLVSRYTKENKKTNKKIQYPKYICYDTFMYKETDNNNLLDNKENKEKTNKTLNNCSEVNINDLLEVAPDNYFEDYINVKKVKKVDKVEEVKKVASVDEKDNSNDRIIDRLFEKRFTGLKRLKIKSPDKNSQFKALAYHLKGNMDKFLNIKILIFNELNHHLCKYHAANIDDYKKYFLNNTDHYLEAYYNEDYFYNIEGDLRTLQAAANIFEKTIVNLLYKKETKSLEYTIISPEIDTNSWEQPFEIIYICKDETETYSPVISTITEDERSKLLNSLDLTNNLYVRNTYHGLLTPRSNISLNEQEVKDSKINKFNIINYERKKSLESLFRWDDNKIIYLDAYQGGDPERLTYNACVLLSMVISATYVFEGKDITSKRIKDIINIEAPNIIKKLQEKNFDYKVGDFYEQDHILDILTQLDEFSHNTKDKFSDLTNNISITGFNIFDFKHIERMMTVMRLKNTLNKKTGCSFIFANEVEHAITILYESSHPHREKWIIIDTLRDELLVNNNTNLLGNPVRSGTMAICIDALTLHSYLMYYLTKKLSKNENYKSKLIDDMERDPTYNEDYQISLDSDLRNFSAYIFSLQT